MLTVVTGPPCSGKSTYVREHAASGDVVVDHDLLAQALGSPGTHQHPTAVHWVAVEARKAAIAEAIRQHRKGTTVWVVQTVLDAADMARWEAVGANVVTLDEDRVELHRRADADGRPAGWHDLIDQWRPPAAASHPPVRQALLDRRSRAMERRDRASERCPER